MARIVRIVSGGVLAALCCVAPDATIRAQSPTRARLLLETYNRGAYAAVTEQLTNLTDLQTFATDLNDSSVSWILAGTNTAPHRRLVAATVALEAAHAHLADWRHARALLEWGCTLLRSNPEPQEGELARQLAAVALAHGAYDSEEHLAHALARFPGEPRLLLAKAIGEEAATWDSMSSNRCGWTHRASFAQTNRPNTG